MSKDVGRDTLLNASPMSKTGLVLAQPTDSNSPDTHRLSSSICETHLFQVGEKCYVGGTRPGVVAYIGETHFAPGEWVGVVLDEPSGKNDGCVSGKRYFQCEPKRGVFSRANRLTLSPIISTRDSSEIDPFELSKFRRSVSPTPSISSAIYKTQNKLRELQVGDRVIVSSGFGSRPGELKFIGETKFAAGNWCGVQLDEPNGKNDGSVEGVKYFECPQKYGVFVPIAKVSLSPSARKSTLSRAGSKESLGSVATLNSVATTNTSRLRMSRLKKPTVSSFAMSTQNLNHKTPPKSSFSMQDLIREKQQYIEQLLKERELDREDLQSQILFFQKTICELNEKIGVLEHKLSESKNKNDELQNAVDEATFCGDELIIQYQESKEKIDVLQKTLLHHGIQVDPSMLSTESSCAKCPELSKKIEQLTNVISDLNIEIEKLKGNNINKSKNDSDLIAKEDELYEKELKVSELEDVIIGLKHEKEMIEFDLQDVKIQIETLQTNKSEEINHMQAKLSELQSQNLNLKGENQTTIDKNISLENRIEVLEKVVDDKQSEIEKNCVDRETINVEINYLKENLKKIEEDVGKKDLILHQNENQYLTLTNSLTVIKNEKELIENELQSVKHQNCELLKEKNEKLKAIENETKNFVQKNEKIVGENSELKMEVDILKSTLKAKDDAFFILNQSYDSLKMENEKMHNENNKSKEEISEKLNSLKEFSQENASLKVILEEYKNENTKLTQSSDTTQKSLCEINTTREKEISELKSKLNNLASENQEIRKTINELNETQKNLKQEIKSYEGKLNDKNSELDANIQIKESCVKELQDLAEKYESLRKDLAQKENLLGENLNKISIMEKSISHYEEDKDSMEKSIIDLKNKNVESETILGKQLKDLQFSKEKVETEFKILQTSIEEKNLEIKTRDTKVESLVNQLKDLETELTSSLKHKESGDNELNKLAMALEIVKSNVKQKELLLIEKDKKIKELQDIIQNIQVEKENIKGELHKLKDKLESSNEFNQEKQNQINSIENQVKQLQHELEILKHEKNETEITLKESKTLAVDLKIEKETLENALKNLQNIQQETEKINKEKNEIITKKDIELNERSNRIHNLEKENTELMSNLKEFKVKYQDLTDTFNTQKLDLEHFNSSNENIKANLEETENLLKCKILELDKTQIQLKDITDEKLSFINKLKENKKTEEQLTATIEKLKEDLKLVNNKLISVENAKEINLSKLGESSTELENAHEKLKKEENLVKESQEKILVLNKEISETLAEKKNINALLEQLQEKNSLLETLKNKEISEMNSKLEEAEKNEISLQEKVKNYEIELKARNSELENIFKTREGDQNNFTKLIETNTNEILNCNKKIKEFEERILELQQKNVSMTEEKLQLEEKYLMEQKYKYDIESNEKNLKEELLKEKSNYDMLNKKYEKLIIDLSALEKSCKILEELEQKTLDLQHINDMVLEENNKLKQDVENAEQEKQDAINNAELLEFENDKEVEKAKQVTLDAQLEVKNLQKQLKLKDKDLTDITKLYEMSHKGILEKAVHNENLEKEIQILKNSIVKSDYVSKNPVIQTTNNVISDSDAADQINFLNSIIADMHKKNETLKARIDILEMNPGDISKYLNLDILNKKGPAPRLFCDICEEFDQHDTEDCPLQSSDSPPSSVGNMNTLVNVTDNDKKNKPPPREYCVNCEVFGHDASACTHEEFF